MIYEYLCKQCGKVEEVFKSVNEFNRVENCQLCDMPMSRLISKGHFYGAKVEDSYFHPALGQIVKGDSDARKIAKSRGMEEVGNEKPSKHLKPKQQDYMEGLL